MVFWIVLREVDHVAVGEGQAAGVDEERRPHGDSTAFRSQGEELKDPVPGSPLLAQGGERPTEEEQQGGGRHNDGPCAGLWNLPSRGTRRGNAPSALIGAARAADHIGPSPRAMNAGLWPGASN